MKTWACQVCTHAGACRGTHTRAHILVHSGAHILGHTIWCILGRAHQGTFMLVHVGEHILWETSTWRVGIAPAPWVPTAPGGAHRVRSFSEFLSVLAFLVLARPPYTVWSWLGHLDHFVLPGVCGLQAWLVRPPSAAVSVPCSLQVATHARYAPATRLLAKA